MFGIILGTLCLVALVATVRGRRFARYGHGHHFGHHFGRHHCGHHDFHRGYGAPFRDSFHGHHAGQRDLLRELFIRLDTTPGQEKAIVAILDAARDRARSVESELREARKRVAALLGSDVLDRTALEERLTEARAVVERLTRELGDSLAAVHEVLDERQRRVLSELIADGSLGRGPYFGC
jgi:Spy/CpxP family protein refolding chaperone